MNITINDQEYSVQRVQETGDVLMLGNLVPMGRPLFLVELGPVSESRYHRFLQAVWKLAADGYSFFFCVNAPIPMVPGVYGYALYAGLEEYVVVQGYAFNIQPDLFRETIILSGEFGNAVYFQGSGEMVKDSSEAIYTKLVELLEADS